MEKRLCAGLHTHQAQERRQGLSESHLRYPAVSAAPWMGEAPLGLPSTCPNSTGPRFPPPSPSGRVTGSGLLVENVPQTSGDAT